MHCHWKQIFIVLLLFSIVDGRRRTRLTTTKPTTTMKPITTSTTTTSIRSTTVTTPLTTTTTSLRIVTTTTTTSTRSTTASTPLTTTTTPLTIVTTTTMVSTTSTTRTSTTTGLLTTTTTPLIIVTTTTMVPTTTTTRTTTTTTRTTTTTGPPTTTTTGLPTTTTTGSGGISYSTYEQQVLTQHNFYRPKHCAAPLTFDPNIRTIAQTYAETLCSTDKYVHSGNTYQGNPMGENLYKFTSSVAIDINTRNGSAGVNSWYDELAFYNFSKPVFASATGHFTQLVWIDTTTIGVGYCCTASRLACYVVCNYYPAGNYAGEFTANVKPIGCT